VDLKRLGRRREGKPRPRNSGVRGRVCKAENVLEELIKELKRMLTQAFRIRWSRRDRYASYRILEDSSTLPPCSVAYLTNLFEAIGVSESCEVFDP
jgi:hypothetical protein